MIAVLLSLALPAQAHTRDELDAYFAEWNAVVAEAGGVTTDLLTEHSDMRARHSWYWAPPPPVARPAPAPTTRPGVHRGMGDNVEQWRGLVAAYFGGEVERALRIMACESGGNPNAYNASSASGLMQVKQFWFDAHGGNAFDPANNLRVAKIVRDSQGWGAWTCSKKI